VLRRSGPAASPCWRGRERRFEVAVAEALDRFSRDQEDIAALYKRFRFAGVSLVTLTEGEITDLHVVLKGIMNALYLKDLADKTRRGLRGRVEAGMPGGGISYGYDTVRKVGPDGMPVHGLRRINPIEAEVVRRIFEAYAAGRSARRIAHDLNAEGIRAPTGRRWGASTISGNAARGTGILNNQLYVGRTIWNKLNYIHDPDSGRRVSRLNDPAHWVIRRCRNCGSSNRSRGTASRRARRRCAVIPGLMCALARGTGAGPVTCDRG
jgi:site-specific DNA recombinase